MKIPFIDSWRTVGTCDRIDALERAVKMARKARTWEERHAALALIRQLVDGIEAHVARFDARGWPRPPFTPQMAAPKPDAAP